MIRRLFCLLGFHTFHILYEKLEEDKSSGITCMEGSCGCLHCGKIKDWRGRWKGKLDFVKKNEWR